MHLQNCNIVNRYEIRNGLDGALAHLRRLKIDGKELLFFPTVHKMCYNLDVTTWIVQLKMAFTIDCTNLKQNWTLC